MPEFYMILARKLSKYPNFYDICPKNLQISRMLHDFCPKMPEFYIIIVLKIFFQNFRGHVPPPPDPVSHAYGIWWRDLILQLSYCKWKIFSIRRVLTLNFDLDLLMMNCDIWCRCWTSVPNFMKVGFLGIFFFENELSNQPTNTMDRNINAISQQWRRHNNKRYHKQAGRRLDLRA